MTASLGPWITDSLIVNVVWQSETKDTLRPQEPNAIACQRLILMCHCQNSFSSTLKKKNAEEKYSA